MCSSSRHLEFLQTLGLLVPDLGPFASLPEVSQANTWVPNRQSCDSPDNQRTLEDHESDFVVCKFAVEASLKLDEAIDASDENKEGGHSESYGLQSAYSHTADIACLTD